MDRLGVRSLDDFWDVIDAHRGELALRDLGLRRNRQPRIDTAFAALTRLDLAPRWPREVVALRELRATTHQLGWTREIVAAKLGVSTRTADRILDPEHLPSFGVMLRWADAAGLGFHVRVAAACVAERAGGVSPDEDQRPEIFEVIDDETVASSAHAAIGGDTSGTGPVTATRAAIGGDTSGTGPAAATRAAVEIDGERSPPPQAARPSDTSGPRIAHRATVETQAAAASDTSGHASMDDRRGQAADDMSIETGIRDRDTSGQAPAGDEKSTQTDLDDDAARGRESDTSGHRPRDPRASTPTQADKGHEARKKILRPSDAAPQPDPMMVSLELRRGEEILFRGEIAPAEVDQTVRLFRRSPRFAGARIYVDGEPQRRPRKRRSSGDEGGSPLVARELAALLQPVLRPVVEQQRALAERQEALDRRLAEESSLLDGIKEIQRGLRPSRASFFGFLAKAIIDELDPEEG
ncbi:MAG: hypothetical protein H6711_24940 [Myxococcales bacterium]|nr:hypothetical protein [Myxococcales bacterium]